jgi:myosin heavy subunit
LPALKVLDILLLMDNMNSKVAPLGLFQLVADKSGGNTMGSDDMNKRVKELYGIVLKNHEPNTTVFSKIRNSTKFTVSHSAKDVIYDSKNFIERNADSMSGSLSKLLIEKSDPMIAMVYSMKTGFEPK